jgi:hypothetical protein
LIVVIVALAACSSGPLRSFTAGDELARFDFAEPATFEEGIYDNATLRIDNGVYRISLTRGDNEIWWAQWGDTQDNVVIEVEVEQISEPQDATYGVACRLRGQVGQEIPVDPTLAAIVSGAEATAEAAAEATSEATAEATSEVTVEATVEAEAAATAEASAAEAEPVLANGDGYLFLIRGDSSYAIMRARGRSLTPLVNWTRSDAINAGPGRNTLRAVCLGDYLALYVNDQFMADTTDSTYTSGQVGLAASAGSRLGVVAQFDNLIVRRAVSG